MTCLYDVMKRLFTALLYAIQTQFASHLAVMGDWSSCTLAHGELCVTATLVILQPGWYFWELGVTTTLLTPQPAGRYFHMSHHLLSDQYIGIMD